MYTRFLKYVTDNNLFCKQDKLLLGVSGGADSVVLAHLINRFGTDFAIAHCNFQLRGGESERDEQFVKELAANYGVEFYNTRFDTRNYALENKISIEMAARKLRYSWFESIRQEGEFQFVLVAHHLDDMLETFLLNISRGTGIRGLSGIKPLNGKVTRPLLFASRKDIEAYAISNMLDFCFDSTNDDVHIKRNAVRHKLIPMFETISPSFRDNLARTICNLAETERVFFEQVNKVTSDLVTSVGGWMFIDKKKLLQYESAKLYLFEILRDFDFSPDTSAQVFDAVDGMAGNQFFSPSHRLVVDRESLIITPVELPVTDIFYIEEEQKDVFDPFEMKITVEPRLPGFKIPGEKHIAVFDFDLIQFPLLIRKWQPGEYFCPLGMSGLKKISDFFIDEKMSIPEKENTWIISSGNQVVWVVGKRIDDRFKILPTTKFVLKMELV
jgi:tRNA(Ile)-lysidine synthase